MKVGKKAEEEVRVEEVEDEEAGCQDFEGGSRRSENARESCPSLLLWVAENNKILLFEVLSFPVFFNQTSLRLRFTF